MMRASFPLTLDLLTVNNNKIDKVEQEEVAEPEPESKKQKMSL